MCVALPYVLNFDGGLGYPASNNDSQCHILQLVQKLYISKQILMSYKYRCYY